MGRRVCCLITRRTGETVRIAESSLVAGKVVPAAPARRRRPRRPRTRSWRGSPRGPGSRWRASRWASGSCGRLRRVHPARQLGAAARRPGHAAGRGARRAYALVRGARAARVHPGRHGCRGHAGAARARSSRRGAGRGRSRRELRIGGAGAARRTLDPRHAAAVTLSRAADDGWLRPLPAHRRAVPARSRWRCSAAGPSVWFATVAARTAAPRPRSGGSWWTGGGPGSRAVEVDPGAAAAGLATAVMAALARRALEEGASAA